MSLLSFMIVSRINVYQRFVDGDRFIAISASGHTNVMTPPPPPKSLKNTRYHNDVDIHSVPLENLHSTCGYGSYPTPHKFMLYIWFRII